VSEYLFESLNINSAWTKLPGAVAVPQSSNSVSFQITLPIMAPSGHGLVLPEQAALTATSLPRIVLIVLLSVLCETAIVDQFCHPVG